MLTQEEIDAVEDYLTRHEQQHKKRLHVLEGTIRKLTGLKPVWNPFDQQYKFIDGLGEPQARPYISQEKKARLYGWFGNENNKGKRWTNSRRYARLKGGRKGKDNDVRPD